MLESGQHRLVIDTEGNINDRGYETGRMELVYTNKARGIIVIKEKGSHYWASRGETKYAPTEFSVWRVVREETPDSPEDKRKIHLSPTSRIYICERIVEFETRSQKIATNDLI
jgi:hypothetical protein